MVLELDDAFLPCVFQEVLVEIYLTWQLRGSVMPCSCKKQPEWEMGNTLGALRIDLIQQVFSWKNKMRAEEKRWDFKEWRWLF